MRALVAAVALLGSTLPAAAQASRDWRPEDRVIIGDFSRITSVAAALDRVYVSSTTSLLIRQPQFERWEGPYDPPDAGLLTRVFASLIDPIDNSLWLARPDGWVHFQPELKLWDQGPVPEGVVTIAFDQDDPVAGLFLRARSGWRLLPRGGAVPAPTRGPRRPVTPASVDDVLRSNPTLQANAAQILIDPRLRTVRYTAAARSFDNRGWYLGTSGVGLLFMEDGAALPERLSFGLPSSRAGAVTDWIEGVWTATDRTPQADAALTFVDTELAAFRQLRGLPASGVPFTQVRDLAGQGTALWAATDFGLARVETGDGRIEMYDASRGLPDSRVYSVSTRENRITAGTARGIVRLSPNNEVERVAPLFTDAAYAVYPVGDSVWVGTGRGLLLALPSEQDLVRPAALGSASLRGPVFGIAALADTLVALTRDQLLWRDPASGAWTLGPNLSSVLGRLRSFALDGPGFWIGGERGVGFARLGAPALRPLREGDIPAAPNDLAVQGDYLWVATDAGLARFRLSAIRP